MNEAGFDVLCGELAHYLSENEVTEACELARKGQQRLRDVSETKRTSFYFLIPCDEHFAWVAVIVSPVVRQESQYPSYDVVARYEPCCDAAQADRVDEHFKSIIQLVYDTCIQAVRRRFDDGWYTTKSPTLPAELTVPAKKQLFSNLASQGNPSHETKRHDERTSPSSEGVRGHSTCPAPLEAQDSPSRTGKNKRRRKSDNDIENNAINKSGVVNPKRKKQDIRTNRQIADSLIAKAISGMDKMKRREKIPFDPFAIQTIVSLCLQHGVEPKKLDSLLSKLEKAFRQYAKRVRDEAKITVWMNWYFSACLRIILHQRRERERDRRASGAYIINLIMNNLLATEGIQALAVIAAYAEHSHTLCEPSKTSEASQVEISGMVADGLRGRLIAPRDHYIIPNAVVWVMTVRKISFQEACHNLGIVNLSILQLDPVCIPIQGTRLELVLGLQYSVAVERWTAFAQMEPTLREKLETCGSSEWARSSVVERFSLVVEEWCRHLRESQPQPYNSADEPAGDLRTGTAFVQNDDHTPTPDDSASSSNGPAGPNGQRNAPASVTGTNWDDQRWLSDIISIVQADLGDTSFLQFLSPSQVGIMGFEPQGDLGDMGFMQSLLPDQVSPMGF